MLYYFQNKGGGGDFNRAQKNNLCDSALKDLPPETNMIPLNVLIVFVPQKKNVFFTEN